MSTPKIYLFLNLLLRYCFFATKSLLNRMQGTVSETTPLLGREQAPTMMQMRKHLSSSISLKHADLPLLVCCYVTGLIDAGAFNAWGIFMGMQTGNTIFLALGASHLPVGSNRLQWLRCLIAIVSFMLGSFCAGRAYRAFGATRRASLSGSFLLQGCFVFIAAILVTTDTIPESDSNSNLILIAIPSLASQFGAQVATSRALGYNEIPTTVLTSVYNDFASDPRLWKWNNPKRNRRAMAAILVLLGGICGGWLSRILNGYQIVLWIGGAIKIILGILWLTFDVDSEG